MHPACSISIVESIPAASGTHEDKINVVFNRSQIQERNVDKTIYRVSSDKILLVSKCKIDNTLCRNSSPLNELKFTEQENT